MLLTDQQMNDMIAPILDDLSTDKTKKDAARATFMKMFTEQRAIFSQSAPDDTSDGYHTFKELYRFRMLYNALLFNKWGEEGEYDVHKSWNHHDGVPAYGGGWFVVVAELPTGQITNHYEAEHWDLFQIDERDTANEWDGHTAQQAADRMQAFLEGREEEGMVEGGFVR